MRKPLMLMRKRGLLGTLFGRHANSSRLSKSIGHYFDLIFGASFDGTNDFALKSSDFSPTTGDSAEFIFAARIRLNGGDGVAQTLYSNAASYCVVQRTAGNVININFRDSAAATKFAISSTVTITADGDYHNIYASGNTAGFLDLMIDAALSEVGATITAGDVDWTRTSHAVGANANGTAKTNGDINFMYLNIVDSLVGSAANYGKFFDAQGNPTLNPYGKGEVAGLTDPILYEAGDYATFADNKGTGGGLTEVGAFERPAS
ncbi:MAG: hypothetical protein KAT90_01450 [Gammaproteobacteria bacterium]|nr:hypothetical protein [Gammaproteobacteria bacterium]